MNNRWLIGALVVVAAVQVAVPVTLIRQREALLRNGRTYKFRTRPVDPVDAFRGRYVQLAFEQNHAPWRSHDEVHPGRAGFACVAEGADGFAVIREFLSGCPDQGDYLNVRASWGQKGEIYFTLPFDRYYLQETKAPQAEQVYREHNQRNPTNASTYAVVRIQNGQAALADLYVGDQPLRNYFTKRKP